MRADVFLDTVFDVMRTSASGLNHPVDIMAAVLSTAETLYAFVDALPSAVDTTDLTL